MDFFRKSKFRQLIHTVALTEFFLATILVCTKGTPGPLQNSTSLIRANVKKLWFWNLIVNIIYYTISIIVDCTSSDDGPHSRIRKVKDYFFCAVVFPLAVIDATLFWCLYSMDKEYVSRRFVDGTFPKWLIHIVHTNTFTLALLEMIICKRKYPTKGRGLIFILSIMFVHEILTVYEQLIMERHTYRIVNALGLDEVVVLAILLHLLAILAYFFGKCVNSFFWVESQVQRT